MQQQFSAFRLQFKYNLIKWEAIHKSVMYDASHYCLIRLDRIWTAFALIKSSVDNITMDNKPCAD